jgi:hypothetical protein
MPTLKDVRVADNGGKTADRYTVLIGRHYWNMSEDANMPNGVCMYAGYTDGAWRSPGDVLVPAESLPAGTQKAIARTLAYLNLPIPRSAK